MLAEIFFYGIVLYLIYKLVFDLILPVSSATRQMREQFRDARSPVQEKSNPAGQAEAFQNRSGQKPGKAAGDYIDFEEVKK